MAGLRIAAAALAIVCGSSAAWSAPLPAVSLECSTRAGVPDGTAQIIVSLQIDGEATIAGTQNDFSYDSELFSIESADCVIDPAIGPGTEADKTLSTSVLSEPARLRNIIVALANVNPLPSGPLYTCTFDVAADTPLGNYTLPISRIVASDPEGNQVPAEGSDCEINIVAASPTPTPPECEDDEDCPNGQVCVNNHCVTPTPSPTPIGFCNDNDDCPEGQVCVDNRCVTVTPTPIGFCNDNDDCPEGQVCIDNRCVTVTPTPIGFCTDNDDCPVGQVCVDNMCVAITPTPRKGGGGGCSCEIDPREHAPGMADASAVLLPVLVLLVLRRRSR